MKISLLSLLLLSALIAAVAIPMGWRHFRSQRASTVDQLQRELREAREILATFEQLRRVHARNGKRDRQTDQAAKSMSGKVERLVHRLEQLGVVPERPESQAKTFREAAPRTEFRQPDYSRLP